MSDQVALLLETPKGLTYAVICNSRSAADRVREQSPDETVGCVPILSFVDAILRDDND